MISEHEPRKGTETLGVEDTETPAEFQNMNPERGRKQEMILLVMSLLTISEHEPRKGTETRYCNFT